MKAHMKTHESPTSKFNIDIYSSKTEEKHNDENDENCPELEEEMSVDWKKYGIGWCNSKPSYAATTARMNGFVSKY